MKKKDSRFSIAKTLLEENENISVEKNKKNSEPQKSFTVRSNESTKHLLDDLQWLCIREIDNDNVSMGEIVDRALKLYAKSIDFEKLRKKYKSKDFNFDNTL